MATLARLLKVSRSGYYAWRARPASKREIANAALCEAIKAIFEDSRGTYGARCVHAELLGEFELRASRHRVASLMRLQGLQGVHRRKGRGRRGRLHELREDRVQRVFTRDAPNRLWVADASQHRTGEGWLYLAVVLDAFHRRVVGWAMDERLDTDLVLGALQMAQRTRRPGPGAIFHSNQASTTAA